MNLFNDRKSHIVKRLQILWPTCVELGGQL